MDQSVADERLAAAHSTVADHLQHRERHLMPKRFNLDHQHAVISPDVSVAPGESHEFSEEEIAAGLTGSWSESDPLAGRADEIEFKRRRDAKRPDLDAEARELGVESPEDLPNRQAVIEAIRAAKSSPSPDDETPEETSTDDNPDPAEPGENKE